ncbi:MAG: PucR family transcriptional regulator [Clostridia bacterium]|nr:PucR family transcriptional regulator [Clostridia bacterium]
MSITVREAMQLNQFKHIHLVAGEKGLESLIERIGILDYEIVEGIKGAFFKGDFVLTTFTAARNNLELLKSSIEDLIDCGISALAIKTIYYKELPLSIIELANKKGLPIFMFDDRLFFEYIIEDLVDAMHARSHMDLLSSKIEILFKSELKRNLVGEIAKEINRNFLNHHVTIFIREKQYRNDESLMKLCERYQRSRYRSIHQSLIKYVDGMILILSYDNLSMQSVELDFNFILQQLGISLEQYWIGISETKSSLNELDMAIKESVYATYACEHLKQDRAEYKAIGIYKILLPYQRDFWLNHFIKTTLDPIYLYDQGKLMETARVYIETGGDIKRTSEILFQHINTIRYRINKIQALMDEKNQGSFYEQLSLAIKAEKITMKNL